MERKPYLDKICAAPHTPNLWNEKETNSVTTLPDLCHTGIQSSFGPARLSVTDPEGKLTPSYVKGSREALKPIFRDHFELISRELVFKTSHNQFQNLVLLDMEDRKRDQHKRRQRSFTGSKSQLGFSDSFNDHGSIKVHEVNRSNKIVRLFPLSLNEQAEEKTETDALLIKDATKDKMDNSDDSIAERLDIDRRKKEEVAMATAERSVHFDSSIHFPRSTSAMKETSFHKEHSEISIRGSSTYKQRPFSRMTLFKDLLDSVPPPKSPNRRYGTLAVPQTID